VLERARSTGVFATMFPRELTGVLHGHSICGRVGRFLFPFCFFSHSSPSTILIFRVLFFFSLFYFYSGPHTSFSFSFSILNFLYLDFLLSCKGKKREEEEEEGSRERA